MVKFNYYYSSLIIILDVWEMLDLRIIVSSSEESTYHMVLVCHLQLMASCLFVGEPLPQGIQCS